MIGLNLLNRLSHDKDSSKYFHLIEFGPGRGTLMNDILRTFSAFPAFFHKVKKCSLVEMSPKLREIQLKNLCKWSTNIKIEWSEKVEGLNVQTDEIPIIIAQEFFDAIPIHVFKKSHNSWKELKVASKMCLIEENSILTDLFKLSINLPNFENDQTLELSPTSWSICHHIRNFFNKCGRGEGIIIDYGNFKPSNNSLRVFIMFESAILIF